MRGPALIITCGHKATETSSVAECLPALEGSRTEWRCARIQMCSPWCVLGKGSWEWGLWSRPRAFHGCSSFKATAERPGGKDQITEEQLMVRLLGEGRFPQKA